MPTPSLALVIDDDVHITDPAVAVAVAVAVTETILRVVQEALTNSS